MGRRPITIYDLDGTAIGTLKAAKEQLKCSRALLYVISEPCEGGRKLTRYPLPMYKRGPDKKKRKQRPQWEPTI